MIACWVEPVAFMFGLAMFPLSFWVLTRERKPDRMSDEWLERNRRER
jgi:hypothetical protein